MAVLTDHPRYITTAGFGCIFSNYGDGPGTGEEPTIITKFFGRSTHGNPDGSDAYDEEKASHAYVMNRCGNFITMNTIFGLDIQLGVETIVRGYIDDINVKKQVYDPITYTWTTAVARQSLFPPYTDVSPTLICEEPNAKGARLDNGIYVKNDPYNWDRIYPVVKMNNLGHDLFDDPIDMNLQSYLLFL